MNDLLRQATRLLADHHGVITSAELRRVRRWSMSTLRRYAGTRGAAAAHQGVFVLRHEADARTAMCALCAAHPTGFVHRPNGGCCSAAAHAGTRRSLHFAVRHGIHLPDESPVCTSVRRPLCRADHRVTRSTGSHRRPGPSGVRPCCRSAPSGPPLGAPPAARQRLVTLGLSCRDRRPPLPSGARRQHPLPPSAQRAGQAVPCAVTPRSRARRGVVGSRQCRLSARRRSCGRNGGRVATCRLGGRSRSSGASNSTSIRSTARVEGHCGDARVTGLHLVEWQVEPCQRDRTWTTSTHVADELTVPVSRPETPISALHRSVS